MTQAANLIAFVQAVGVDVKSLNTKTGTLSSLTTTEKGNLVAALNEVKASLDAIDTSSIIDDSAASESKAYSSTKTVELINSAITALVGGAPEALDTLKELADYVASDETAMSALTASLASRVRFDEDQTLTAPQQLQACTNIGIGDPTTDFAAAYTTAKA